MGTVSPSRSTSSAGPRKACSIVICWSRTIPIKSASGSVETSRSARSSPDSWSGVTVRASHTIWLPRSTIGGFGWSVARIIRRAASAVVGLARALTKSPCSSVVDPAAKSKYSPRCTDTMMHPGGSPAAPSGTSRERRAPRQVDHRNGVWGGEPPIMANHRSWIGRSNRYEGVAKNGR